MRNFKKGFTLIELLVVIGILTVLLTAVLIAINPIRQFGQARDTQKHNDVLTILNAVQQNMADNKGAFTKGGSAYALPTSATDIASGGTADICSAISTTYVCVLPVDPGGGSPTGGAKDCTVAYDTKYTIMQDATTHRITVAATPDANGTGDPISVTR